MLWYGTLPYHSLCESLLIPTVSLKGINNLIFVGPEGLSPPHSPIADFEQACDFRHSVLSLYTLGLPIGLEGRAYNLLPIFGASTERQGQSGLGLKAQRRRSQRMCLAGVRSWQRLLRLKVASAQIARNWRRRLFMQSGQGPVLLIAKLDRFACT